jgi:hypothetical protein
MNFLRNVELLKLFITDLRLADFLRADSFSMLISQLLLNFIKFGQKPARWEKLTI